MDRYTNPRRPSSSTPQAIPARTLIDSSEKRRTRCSCCCAGAGSTSVDAICFLSTAKSGQVRDRRGFWK